MDDARVRQIYEDLGKFIVELPRDPGAVGPVFLQDLISKVRGYLNATSVYLTEVLQEQHSQEMDLEAMKAAFQISSDDHMANNRQVSTLPAIQDRLAMVNVLLASERRSIIAQERVLKNLGHVEKVIRHRHKELENTMSAIRLQRSLFETEIRTGASYGDESEQSRGTRWGSRPARSGDDMSEEDLARAFEEELEQGEPSQGSTPSIEVSADAELAELLEAVGTPVAQEVVVDAAPRPNGSGVVTASVEPEDVDIQRFLDGEEDDADLFKDL